MLSALMLNNCILPVECIYGFLMLLKRKQWLAVFLNSGNQLICVIRNLVLSLRQELNF